MKFRDELLLKIRDLRLAVRRLLCVRGRGLLERAIAVFYHGRRSPISCRTVHRKTMTIAPRGPAVQRWIWNVGEYEAATNRLLTRTLEPEDVFFGIGAHMGYYSCLVGRLLRYGRVVSLEPNPPDEVCTVVGRPCTCC